MTTATERMRIWRLNNPEKVRINCKRRAAKLKAKRKNATRICEICGDVFNSYNQRVDWCPKCKPDEIKRRNIITNRIWQSGKGKLRHRINARNSFRKIRGVSSERWKV